MVELTRVMVFVPFSCESEAPAMLTDWLLVSGTVGAALNTICAVPTFDDVDPAVVILRLIDAIATEELVVSPSLVVVKSELVVENGEAERLALTAHSPAPLVQVYSLRGFVEDPGACV